MKRLSFCLYTFFFTAHLVDAQSNIRPPALGISFILNDFITPQRIRSQSLSQVVHNGNWAKLAEMGSGFGLHYFQGLKDHFDFSASLTGSFVRNVLPGEISQDNSFMMEADASINIKMMTDHYLFTPYLSFGAGAGKYESYYSAIIPLGIGFKINLFDEAAIFINTQYRIPVTMETNNFHFMHNIGIAGVIGQKKQNVFKQAD